MALEEEQGAAKNSRIKSADNSATQEDRAIPSWGSGILSSIAEIWIALDRYNSQSIYRAKRNCNDPSLGRRTPFPVPRVTLYRILGTEWT